MWIFIASLVLFAVMAMIAGYTRNKGLQRKIDNGELDSFPEIKEADVECCGQHEICERDNLLTAVSKQIEYYSDEELNTFIGRIPEEYTPEEADKFRDVFYVMQDIDVARWVCSPQLRGIDLSDEIEDEVFLVVGERRIHL